MCYYLKNDLKCENCEHYDSEYKPELGEKMLRFLNTIGTLKTIE